MDENPYQSPNETTQPSTRLVRLCLGLGIVLVLAPCLGMIPLAICGLVDHWNAARGVANAPDEECIALSALLTMIGLNLAAVGIIIVAICAAKLWWMRRKRGAPCTKSLSD